MELDTMFDISAQTRAAMPEVLTLPGTVDPHGHFGRKNTGQMARGAAECATEHEATVDIPNVPGITSLEALRERYADIHSCIPYGQRTQVLMTPLVNDTTDPEFIRAARKARLIHGVKIFWQGVSNDYGNSISSAAGAEKLIRSLGDTVCTLHAECRDDYDGKRIPIKNREFWCVENEVSKIIKMNPEAPSSSGISPTGEPSNGLRPSGAVGLISMANSRRNISSSSTTTSSPARTATQRCSATASFGPGRRTNTRKMPSGGRHCGESTGSILAPTMRCISRISRNPRG